MTKDAHSLSRPVYYDKIGVCVMVRVRIMVMLLEPRLQGNQSTTAKVINTLGTSCILLYTLLLYDLKFKYCVFMQPSKCKMHFHSMN